MPQTKGPLTQTHAAATLCLCALVGSVNGHAILVAPPARSNQVGIGIKLQPFTDAKALADAGCGGVRNRDPGVQIPQVAYLPGSTVTVTWQLTIPHPADVLDTGIRVALHTSPVSSFALNILAGGLTGEVGYTPVSAGPVDAAANSLQSITVQLPPGVTCDYCTLQWIWAARQDGGSYVGCADISITPNAPTLPNFALLPSQDGNILPGVPGEGEEPPIGLHTRCDTMHATDPQRPLCSRCFRFFLLCFADATSLPPQCTHRVPPTTQSLSTRCLRRPLAVSSASRPEPASAPTKACARRQRAASAQGASSDRKSVV